jgi:glutamine amidotransferase
MELERAERILLPGVGSAEKCHHRLRELNMIEPLLATKKPVLGICIGLQLQFDYLEEGSCSGLGIHSGSVRRIPASSSCPVPHMGWNQVRSLGPDPLLKGLDNEYFFFTHSFVAPIGEGTLGVTEYGVEFASVIRKNNWWGVQFHPEKSAAAGRRLLKNFMEV